MDAHIKAGEVYLQPRKPTKKWKHMWMTLYPPSRSAVGRLEIQDMGMSKGGGSANVVLGSGIWRDGKVKMIRLSEVLTVLALPPQAEACPKDNMSAFCVETEERKLVFAVMKDECAGWVDRLCDIAFQRGTWCSSASVSQLQMKENQIYATRERVCEFLVHVQQTDAAACCGLQGASWLQVGQDGLVLRESEKNRSNVWEWPYKLLRRYGKDKLVLSIEAGRRCDSGPGTFSFETEQAGEIFSLMEAMIKQQCVSSDSAGNHLSVTTTGTANRRQNLPLPKIPDMATVAASFEENLNVQIRKSPGSEAGVYAQSIDSLGRTKPLLHAATDVYVDPADILPIIPPSIGATEAPPILSSVSCSNIHGDQPEPVYSEVFDNIHPHRVQNNKAGGFGDAEPIYYEPTRETGGPPHITVSKPDPFSHLYAQVHKHPSSCVLTEKYTSTVKD